MGNAFEEYRKMKKVRVETELETKHALKKMRAAQYEAEHIFNKKVNELIDSVGLMPTLIEFLKDFYEDNRGYYNEIYFVRSIVPADYFILIGKILLEVSNDQYVNVLGLTNEEQEHLKKELPQYKFNIIY